jgi:predicted O-linked N-acetylglucosamine transferase (SPINDLY family)
MRRPAKRVRSFFIVTSVTEKNDPLIALQRRADELLLAKRYADARAIYERILEAEPQNAYVLYQLAGALEGVGDLEQAARICHHGLSLSPDQPALLHRLGGIAHKSSRFVYALETFERLKARYPEFPLIDAMIGDELASLGRGTEAISAFDRALALAQDNARLQSDRLFVLNYFGLIGRKELFEEHRRWGEKHESELRRCWSPHTQPFDPERRLRVGYVSADLRRHAVAHFIEGILRNHDRAAFEIHAIDVSPFGEDDVTRRLRGYCDHLHRVGHLSDDELAGFIRERAIDVLVDLSGHTAHNRLLVFARRPAPVQVTWFGYMNTTGLSSIDYRLTDASLDPPGHSDDFYTEKLFRLSAAACFQPESDSPEVGGLPAESTGRVTVASLNQWTKVTEPTKDLWSRILRDVPTSRLVVVAQGGADPGVRRTIAEDFLKRGVQQQQLDVIGFLPLKSFLAFLNTVDLALDPFPYGGGTTTLHAAWMGVPSVTLESDSELGRSTAAILRGLGIGELVARDCEEYHAIAMALVHDIPRLRSYRNVLRARFERSPLMDAAPLTREVEAAFRIMWRRCCVGRVKLD